MNDFDRWFIAQHGERPSNEALAELAIKIVRALNAYNEVRDLFSACKQWDAQYKSALSAKQAFGGENGNQDN